MRAPVNILRLAFVAKKIDSDDLIDAREVAHILGLRQPNSVSTYQKRYRDMPRPAVNLGQGRTLLWLRPQILSWARKTGRIK